MATDPVQTLDYHRANFSTRLPTHYLYSPSHFWAVQCAPEQWRIGLTKFATRMLGEMVDHAFTAEPGTSVGPGQIIGWIEGFKAISDVFCIASGVFNGGNPALKQKITLVNQDPYSEGWLYSVQGQPDSNCLDVNGYRDLLDKTIDRLLEQKAKSDP